MMKEKGRGKEITRKEEYYMARKVKEKDGRSAYQYTSVTAPNLKKSGTVLL